VVVTHQQQTMEVADVLYGVTMEPGGSSKVIAKQLTAAGHKL
jgi:chromosome segregation protein